MDAQRSTSFRLLPLIVCFGVALLAGATPISAQVMAHPGEDRTEPVSAQEAQPGANLNDAQLTALAQTHLAITSVQAELQEGLAGNYEPASRAEVQEAAHQKIEEIFAQGSLSEEEYAQLLFLVGTDEALWTRFEKALADAQP